MIAEVPGVVNAGHAEDSLGAMRCVRELSPDVVVLDISLRGGSGLDVLHEIKKAGRAPVVIVLSNLSYEQYRRRCHEAGADYFFDKSTEFERVAEVLKAMSLPGGGLEAGRTPAEKEEA